MNKFVKVKRVGFRNRKATAWLCKCENCGRVKIINESDLEDEDMTSCNCSKKN